MDDECMINDDDDDDEVRMRFMLKGVTHFHVNS